MKVVRLVVLLGLLARLRPPIDLDCVWLCATSWVKVVLVGLSVIFGRFSHIVNGPACVRAYVKVAGRVLRSVAEGTSKDSDDSGSVES